LAWKNDCTALEEEEAPPPSLARRDAEAAQRGHRAGQGGRAGGLARVEVRLQRGHQPAAVERFRHLHVAHVAGQGGTRLQRVAKSAHRGHHRLRELEAALDVDHPMAALLVEPEPHAGGGALQVEGGPRAPSRRG
jgi:hypothetical protein